MINLKQEVHCSKKQSSLEYTQYINLVVFFARKCLVCIQKLSFGQDFFPSAVSSPHQQIYELTNKNSLVIPSPETNSSHPEKMAGPKGKGSSSNHQFSGATRPWKLDLLTGFTTNLYRGGIIHLLSTCRTSPVC